MWLKLKLKLKLAEATPIPKFFGIAYIDIVRFEAVCYLMPLNVIVKWGVSIYEYLRYPKQSWWEKRETEIYSKVEKEIDKKYQEKRHKLDKIHDILMTAAVNSPLSKDTYGDLMN